MGRKQDRALHPSPAQTAVALVIGDINLHCHKEPSFWDVNDLTLWALVERPLNDRRTILYPRGISPEVGDNIFVDPRAVRNAARHSNVSSPWRRAVVWND